MVLSGSPPTAASRGAPGVASLEGDRLMALWLLACAAMVFAMVVIGGITRLTESGLSITEWKPVSGIIPPLTEEEWEESFARYRQIPEYLEKNAGMSLADYKGIYWWEFVHRLWGRLIGIAFAVPFLVFLLRGHIARPLVPRLLLLLGLGGLQGALGWAMVESGLVHRTDVSQYRLVAHLGLAVAIYALLLWTAFPLLRRGERHSAEAPLLRPWVAGAAALTVLTILSGGFVAGLDAGRVHNTFPLMSGSLVPEDYALLSPPWKNAFENPAAAQFHHRLLAMATLGWIVLAWLRGRTAGLDGPAAAALHALPVVALAQLGLGVATLLLAVPIPLAALHQAGAMLLLSVALWALFETSRF